jgi:protoheme IX farnesyltransferase
MPPLIGWAAARGQLDLAAWVLFAILFLWQFPHFLAIAWMYREDYGRAGIRMLPVVEPEGRVTGQQIVAFTIMLIPVSLLPAVMGISGRVYLVSAIVLGLLFLASSVPGRARNRISTRASSCWLPALLAVVVRVMVLNR